MERLPRIMPGWQVFTDRSSESVAAVRAVETQDPPELVINVENGGDFRVPLSAVARVEGDKVVLRWDLLSVGLRGAFERARSVEDYPPPDEEVELVGPMDEQVAELHAYARPGDLQPKKV